MILRRRASSLALALLSLACSAGPPAPPGPPGPPAPPAPGALAALPATTPAALRQQLEAARAQTADGLLAERALPFAARLPYAPRQAAGMDRIAASSQAPSADEERDLDRQGFSISEARRFPTFTYGYAALYADHLPLYISADSIAHAVHKGYDQALESIEVGVLIGDLDELLTGMRRRLASGAAPWLKAEPRGDLDLLLTVAQSLLAGLPETASAGGDQGRIDDLVARMSKAEGTAEVQLFGSPRTLDFSQARPRGHYMNSEKLQRYFRAMMWLGRTELRLLDGEGRLDRRQLEAAVAMGELLDEDARARFDRIDRVVGLFVGEHDSMTLDDLGRLQKITGPGAALASQSDAQLTRALTDGGLGAQRIASQLMTNDSSKTLPPGRIFQLFGQRYTVDSHVLSNVVYDRAGGGTIKRMMPSPLDAAFAALGNDQAAALLAPELRALPYAPDLAAMRVLVDAHEPAYWESSLYTTWLSALRALSPSPAELRDPKAAGLPTVFATEPWGRRVLNAQLASWAELRHDTLLYAKQSYTMGALCEFPDAYVDPYPAFYAAIGRYAERAQQTIDGLRPRLDAHEAARLGDHFARLRAVASKLQGMAERQRAGQPFTAEQMAFVNDTVTLRRESAGCTSIERSAGWYPSLFLRDPLAFDPTIADVHTQSTDASGAPVGKVLHVGTGMPRRLIVTVETCHGPRAYAGLVSAYSETITGNFQRMNDLEWKQQLLQSPAPPPPWLGDLVREAAPPRPAAGQVPAFSPVAPMGPAPGHGAGGPPSSAPVRLPGIKK